VRRREFAATVILAGLAGSALTLLLSDTSTGPVTPAPRATPLRIEAPPAPAPAMRPEPVEEPRVLDLFRRLERALLDVRLDLELWRLRRNGWRTFEHAIPEDVAWRGHDFLYEVEAASRKRWFAPAERGAYDRALEAWRRTRQHASRLREDRAFRAGESMLANLALLPAYEGRHLLAHRDPPFLLVYVSELPLSVWDLPEALRTERNEQAVDRRRTFALRVLRRDATVHRAVYDAMRRRFGEALHLEELSAAYGGSPDLPHGVRSFEDGVTLVSVTLADLETARAVTEATSRVTPGFHADSGEVVEVLSGEKEPTQRSWVPWYGREAAAQLVHWFTRQRNRWRKPEPGQLFVDAGVASWLGGVQLDGTGRAAWTGVGGSWLKSMAYMAEELRAQGNEYRLLPVRVLVGATSRHDVRTYGAVVWQLDPETATALYAQQAWALAYFLGRADGPYAEAFTRYLDLVLHREAGWGRAEHAFAEAFRLQGPEDWAALDEAFSAYVREHLLTMDPEPYLRPPPPLATWDR